MLTITVAGVDMFDDTTQEFITQGGVVLQLEHSLVALSKWESEFETPFLGQNDKSPEQMLAYIGAMIVTPNPPEGILQKLSEENFEAINNHIDKKMTATWFGESPSGGRNREVITAELIYYWMTVFSIPFECETWHLNRLFTLIRICNIKQSKEKKMSRGETAARNRELNERRKAQLKTNG